MSRTFKLLVGVLVMFGLLAAVASAASSPSVSTGAPSSVKDRSAVLHGTVNPNGAKTSYRFEWGLTSGYGSTGPVHSVGSGTKPVSVQLTIGNLLPGTVYHYRIVALNSVGGVVGADRTFKTTGNPPPYAATGPSTQLTSSGATVTGVIDPRGVTTSWHFQYGLSPEYTSSTVAQTLPAGNNPVPVAQALQGLQSGTVFHYRIVAVNRGVTEYGADATFMTYPRRRPVPRVHYRNRPKHDRFAPFSFTTSGKLSGTGFVPRQYACQGSVSVRFTLGRRALAHHAVPVLPDCTFSAQTVLRHRRHHARLRVFVRYLGSGYLTSSSARPGHVTAG